MDAYNILATPFWGGEGLHVPQGKRSKRVPFKIQLRPIVPSFPNSSNRVQILWISLSEHNLRRLVWHLNVHNLLCYTWQGLDRRFGKRQISHTGGCVVGNSYLPCN